MFKSASATILTLALTLSLGVSPSFAQTYSSGSTGANGAFPPASPPSGTTRINLDLGSGGITYFDGSSNSLGTATVGAPTSAGVFNFTTFTAPTNITVTVTPDRLNRPAQFLASGNVTITGTLFAGGQVGQFSAGGLGGPGGFNGGLGASAGCGTSPAAPGGGPGGGLGGNTTSFNGTPGTLVISNLNLTPLIGGSGGGGRCNTDGGGGGGGGLLIASSGTINVTGSLSIIGGNGPGNGTQGNGGSGGSVRLVASNIQGSGSLNASGGFGANGVKGADGIVRAEAFTLGVLNVVAGTYVQSTNPLPPFPTTPTISLVSIAGVNAPAIGTGGSATQPDISLGTAVTTQVALNVTSTNVPANTAFTVRFAPLDGAQTTSGNPITYSGTIGANGAGSVQVTIPSGISIVSLLASYAVPSTFIIKPPPTTANPAPTPLKVARIEVSSKNNGPSEVVYITESGNRISAASLTTLTATK